MLKCIALRHILCEDLATFTGPIQQTFADFRYLDMQGRNAPPPEMEDVATADLVICLGGPQGVYEAGQYPFIQREIELVSQRIATGRPTLGICLGAQIIAAAAGANVYPSGHQEIGWYPIQFQPWASADPIFAPLASGSEMFFHWHGDTFALPKEGRLLGSSELTPHQGFTIGQHTVALQFHVEVDALALDNWLQQYAANYPSGPGVMPLEKLREMAHLHAPSLSLRAKSFIEKWLQQWWQPAN